MELKITNVVILLALQISIVFGVCVDNKYSTISDHTGCLSKSPSATPFDDMTTTVKNEIVNTHNNLRSQLNAANMQKMVWDDELATLAQMWADNCIFQHDSGKRSIPGRFSVGQNLALGHQGWSQVLNSWWNEIEHFQYNNSQAMEFSAVGHFTQMAWAESAKVGCGWAICTNPEMMQYYRGRYFVCNYAPAGNNPWWMPYKQKNAAGMQRKCASCPGTCDSNGLCDCGGKVCQNGGTLDVNTCQCSCLKPFHTADNCGLDCRAARDSRFCGGFWTVPKCQRYTNVPFECPHMCGLCPTADYRLQPGATSATTTTTAAAPATTTRRPVTTTRPPVTTRRPVTTRPPVTTRRPVTTRAPVTTTTRKTTTEKSVDIKIEDKGGKTVITLPERVITSSNGAVRVVQPNASLYSTLLFILKLI